MTNFKLQYMRFSHWHCY